MPTQSSGHGTLFFQSTLNIPPGRTCHPAGIAADPLMPWYFPAPGEYAAKLENGGFAVERIELFPRPTPLPGRLQDWLETFAESFLSSVTAGERPRLLEEIEDRTRSSLRNSEGVWSVDYVRLRFSARLRS